MIRGHLSINDFLLTPTFYFPKVVLIKWLNVVIVKEQERAKVFGMGSLQAKKKNVKSVAVQESLVL